MFRYTTHTEMKKAAGATLIVFVIVAVAGVWMRAVPWIATPLPFENIRHAHSHLAFLGWLFSGYGLVLLRLFTKAGSFSGWLRRLFWGQLAVACAMFSAFLKWGYAPVPIALLTVHTLLAVSFLVKMMVQRDKTPGASRWFLAAAIGFFFLSSLGPFFIPFIQVFGNGDAAAIRDAIHFYLHFHYNGWFVFGFLAMFYRYLEQNEVALPRGLARFHLVTGIVGPVLLYLPSAPGQSPLVSTLWVGFAPVVQAADWLQLAGAIAFVVVLWKGLGFRWGKAPGLVRFALGIYLLKVLLEWLVLLPGVDAVVNIANRWLVICWLHLLFLGMATPAVWWQFVEQGWLADKSRFHRVGIGIYFMGFVLTEGVLLVGGLGQVLPYAAEVLLLGSTFLLLGVLAECWSALVRVNLVAAEDGVLLPSEELISGHPAKWARRE